MKKSFILLLTLIYTFTFSGVIGLAEEERVDVAALAPAASSSVLDKTKAEYANDGINENETYTKWVSAADDVMPWWSVDLGMEYKISAIEIDAGIGGSEDERTNFRIVGANNADFSDEIVLVNEISADYGDAYQTEINADERVRFVKVEKTKQGSLSIGEIRIFVNRDDILQGNETEKEETQITLPAADRYALYSDIAGLPCEESVYLLSQIGILNGYTDGTFQPDKKMTRAEFTAVIIRMLNQVPSASGISFSDVDASHWAFKEISTAAELGLVNGTGNGRFSPNDTVTASQVMKILVSAIGYSKLAEANGGFPNGYNSVASDLDLYDGAGIYGDDINRGQIAVVMKNALDARTPEYNFDYDKVSESFDGESMLNKYLKLKKNRAVVDGVNGTTLKNTNIYKSENYISIDGVEYYSQIPDLSDYLGLTVTYYFTDDDKKAVQEVVAILVDPRNEVKVIASEDIEDFDDGYLYYIEDEKSKKEQITTKIYVIYNGSVLRLPADNDMKPANGYVTLIDNNGDGVWDVYMVDDVKIGIVNIANASTGEIYLRKSTTPIEIEVSDDIVKVYDSETNAELSLSDIKSGDVVSIRTSKNEDGIKKHNIIISRKTLFGTLTGKNEAETEISIDGVKYNCASSFDFNSVAVGDEGEFYLSDEDFAVLFEGRSAKRGIYGYLKRAWLDEDTEDVMLRVFGQDGSWKTYTASEKIRVDGVKAPSSDYVLTNIVNTDNTYYQPIKFSVNALGVVTEIDTDYSGTSENEETRLNGPVVIGGNETEDDMFWTSTGIIGHRYGTNNDTIMMVVPDDKSAEEDYNIITTASFPTYDHYTIDGYNMGKNNVFEFVIFKGVAQLTPSPASVFVVEDITEALNDYEEAAYCLSGYFNGKYAEYFVEPSSENNTQISNIKKGDLLTVSVSAKNEIDSFNKKLYLSRDLQAGETLRVPVTDIISRTFITDEVAQGGNFATHYYAYGTVKVNEDGMMMVDVAGNDPRELLINVGGNTFNTYYCNVDEDEIRLGSISDIKDEESVGSSRASKVFIHMQNRELIDIVIIE